MPFSGFPEETIGFLRDLGRHNDKTWFDHHRADYVAHWLEPGKAFVEAVRPGLTEIAPGVRCEPRVNGSIFRLHRDTRFSQDKRPYKEHLDMWFWEGAKRRDAVSGFFFRLKADYLAVGAGAHKLDKDALHTFRDLVVDENAGPELVDVIQRVEKAGCEVQGEHYKRLPRGFSMPKGEKAEERERLLRFSALFVVKEHDLAEVDKEVHSPAVLELCLDHWKEMAPLHRWLVDQVRPARG